MYYLDPLSYHFPPVEDAYYDGLLCLGGDLSPTRLLCAYSSGIFPWFSEDGVVHWFAPTERFVLYPNDLIVSKTMRQLLRRDTFRITLNFDFAAVIQGCATAPRNGQAGTWITSDFVTGYYDLHRAGWAHSVEVWQGNRLVGGLYGIIIGKVFSGESMFTTVSNASKEGFVILVQWLATQGFTLIDCQTETVHLASFGAQNIDRTDFMHLLQQNTSEPLFESGRAEKVVLKG